MDVEAGKKADPKLAKKYDNSLAFWLVLWTLALIPFAFTVSGGTTGPFALLLSSGSGS